jgi:glycosyltransferase involved in cell wall biosynthesis
MAGPKRILVLNWRCLRHPQNGGSELNIFEQSKQWVKDGHEVTLICSNPGSKYAPSRNEVMDGIKVRRMGGQLTLYLWAALYMLFNAHKYDTILDIANGIPFFAPLFTRRPVVLLVHHVHGKQWFSEFPYLFACIGSFLERKVVPFVYRQNPVIAVSPTTHDNLLALGFLPSQLNIVYNGVEQASEIGDSAESSKNFQVAYIGRLKRYKRLDLLVQAVAQLRERFPQIKLDLGGDGDARADIIALVNKLGLQDCVKVHGFVDNRTKENIMRSATVFVTPSMHEGWGLSVIEANTFGCPAVAYDVPGLRVAIRNGETGLLASDDKSFREAIASVLADPARREYLSKGALKWAARFSWKTCAEQTLNIMLNYRAYQAEPEGETETEAVRLVS